MTATQKEDLATVLLRVFIHDSLRKNWRNWESGNLTLKEKLEARAHAARKQRRATQTPREPITTQDLANTRLIAAAPELLVALESILNITLIDNSPWTRTIAQEARAAIAKAKGEE